MPTLSLPGFSAHDSGSGRHDLIALHPPDSLLPIPGVLGKAIGFLGRGFELEATGSRGAYNFRTATVEAIVQYPGSNAFVFQYARYEPGIARGFWLGFNAAGILELVTGHDKHSSKWNECKSAQSLVPGRIYHIAGVLDDGGLNKVYVDGVKAGSRPTTEYLPYDDRLRVGYGYGGGAFVAYLRRGALDEL